MPLVEEKVRQLMGRTTKLEKRNLEDMKPTFCDGDLDSWRLVLAAVLKEQSGAETSIPQIAQALVANSIAPGWEKVSVHLCKTLNSGVEKWKVTYSREARILSL